jgi:SOS response associated peptidase (SRAP)
MKDRSPFGIAALWDNWRDLTSGEWVRTLCIGQPGKRAGRAIHDRMPAILRSNDEHWLSLDLLLCQVPVPFPSEPVACAPEARTVPWLWQRPCSRAPNAPCVLLAQLSFRSTADCLLAMHPVLKVSP